MSVYRNPPWTMTNAFSTLEQTLDWSAEVVKAPDAWTKTRGAYKRRDGSIGRVKVLVIDTGTMCDPLTGKASHPDLIGAYLMGRDFTGSPYGVADRNGHGTATSALICANNNDLGMVGIAADADVYIAKALGDDGSGMNSWIAAAVDWGDELDVDVISFSGGSPQPDADLSAAIDRYLGRRKGRFFIAAAGNDGNPNSVNFPASHPQVLAVGATTRNGQTARFSSRGEQVDCACPGEGVKSCNRDGDYGVFNGTSFACPIAAGIVILCLAHHLDETTEHATPLETFDDLLRHIEKACVPSNDPEGQGFGLLRADLMVADDVMTTPAKPIFTVNVGPFTWSVPARAGDLSSIGIAETATPEQRETAMGLVNQWIQGLAEFAAANANTP